MNFTLKDCDFDVERCKHHGLFVTTQPMFEDFAAPKYKPIDIQLY